MGAAEIQGTGVQAEPRLELIQNPPAWRRYLSYAAVALMSVSANIEKFIKQEKPTPVWASPFDIFLPILFLLMLLDMAQRRPWARFRIPPIPSLLWVGVGLLSCFLSQGSIKAWAMNPLFFGVVAVWVFQNLAGDADEYRRLTLVLLGSFSVCLLIALKQYVGPAGVPFDPTDPSKDLGGVTHIRLGGWYGYRGLMGAQGALLVPVAIAFTLMDKDSAVRAGAGAIGVLSLCVTLAAGGFIGACAGIIAVVCAYGIMKQRWTETIAAFVILVAVIGGVLPRLPRHNPEVLLRGVALYAHENNDDEQKKPTARLRRYQAALDVLGMPADPMKPESAPNWIKGVGVGRYQKAVDTGYQSPYQKPGRPTDEEAAYDMEADERFTWGFLENVTVETGLPGLLAVLLLFGTWIAAANGAFARLVDDTRQSAPGAMLALASFGAGCGALVMSIFASALVRGVGGSFAFFFALAICAQSWSTEPKKV